MHEGGSFFRDVPADLRERMRRAPGPPVPPWRLRRRTGQGSRATFLDVGEKGAAVLLRVVAEEGTPNGGSPGRWLDLGCGCGRIARFLEPSVGADSFVGVDVDEAMIAWCRRHLAGSFRVMRPRPPLDFPDASFGVVYAISIFSHYTEDEQLEWLDELRRILRPGGLFVATTLAPDRIGDFKTSPEDRERLLRDGFACVNPDGQFNERATFIAEAYLDRTWRTRFARVRHEPRGFLGYQDLSLWRR